MTKIYAGLLIIAYGYACFGMEIAKAEIQKNHIEQHRVAFESYVKAKLWAFWGAEKIPWDTIEGLAMKWEGLDNHAAKIAITAAPYFKNDISVLQGVIKRLGEVEDLKIINAIIDEHSKKGYESRGASLSALAKISYKKHIESIDLSRVLATNHSNEVHLREELYKNPEQYLNIVNKGLIDKASYCKYVTIGLFARYWQEEVCNRMPKN